MQSVQHWSSTKYFVQIITIRIRGSENYSNFLLQANLKWQNQHNNSKIIDFLTSLQPFFKNKKKIRKWSRSPNEYEEIANKTIGACNLITIDKHFKNVSNGSYLLARFSYKLFIEYYLKREKKNEASQPYYVAIAREPELSQG